MNIEVLHRENYDFRQKLEKAEVKIDKLEREIEQLHIKNDQLKQIENTAPTASNYAIFHEKSLRDPKLKFRIRRVILRWSVFFDSSFLAKCRKPRCA